MKFPLSSLLFYFQEIDRSLNLDYIDILNNLGLEVDEFYKKISYNDIVVAEIIEFSKHPNADRLNVCRVFDGKDERQIVCGAKNVRSGMKVALSKVGAIIPNGNFIIKESKIRGIESQGMMCSANELSIEQKHNIGYIKNLGEDGIIEFSDEVKLGDSIEKYISNDDIFDIKITPDRGYANGIYGIARDLGALNFGSLIGISKFLDKICKEKNFKLKENISLDKNFKKNANLVRGIEENSALYLIKIDNIKNFCSPNWLIADLLKFGLNPINAVVDVLNFLMIHFGYPMHAYDCDKIALPLSVKSLTNERKLKTLANEEIILPKDSLVITDVNDQICSLAGIIGGDDCKISENTRNIVIECGFFSRNVISKTSSLLKIKTDALYRFERGVDPELCENLIKIATDLIVGICGGDFTEFDFQNSDFIRKNLTLRFSKIKKILGFEISRDVVLEILKKLEFNLISEVNDVLSLSCPHFRTEIETENEIISEIGRIYGYKNLPKKDSLVLNFNRKFSDDFLDKIQFITKIKKILSRDFNECISMPFISEEMFDLFKQDIHHKDELLIQNPINASYNYLRNNLLIGLLEKMSFNLKNYKFVNINLFEVGKVFFDKENQLDRLTGLSLLNFDSDKNFYFIKSKIANLLFEITDYDMSLHEKNICFSHPNKCFSIKIQNTEIGMIGLIHPKISSIFQCKKDLWFFDFSINEIQKVIKKKQFLTFNQNDYKDFVVREFSILIDKNLNCEQIINSVKTLENIKFVEIIDIYHNDHDFESKKSISILIGIQKLEKYDNISESQFLDDEFKKAIDKTINLGAILRDGVSSK